MAETITTKIYDLTSEIFLSAGEFLIVNFGLIYNHIVNSASSNGCTLRLRISTVRVE